MPEENLELETQENPPVAPEPQPAPTPAAEESLSLRGMAQQYGYDPADMTDQQIAEKLWQAHSDFERVLPLAQVGQKFAARADKWDDFEKWEAEQAKLAEATKTPEQGFKWDAPPYDPEWERVTIDDDPVGYQQAQAKLKAWRQHEEATRRRLATNPREFLSPVIDDILSPRERQLIERIERMERQVQERFQAEEQQRYASEESVWLQENAKAFYEHDAKGNPIVQNGQMVPTPFGNQVYQQYQRNRNAIDAKTQKPFFATARDAMNAALSMVPQSNGQPTAPQVPPEKPQRFLDTVTEAEMRPAERNAGGEDAPASMYASETQEIEAAFRAAEAEQGFVRN
jgi:hypothetical protein